MMSSKRHLKCRRESIQKFKLVNFIKSNASITRYVVSSIRISLIKSLSGHPIKLDIRTEFRRPQVGRLQRWKMNIVEYSKACL